MIKRQKRLNKIIKFCKSLFFLNYVFVFLFHYLFLRIHDYLIKIIDHSWLSGQLQVNNICKVQELFFKILNSKDVKSKSFKSFIY